MVDSVMFWYCQTLTGKSLSASCFVHVCQKFYWIAVKNVSFLFGVRLVFQ